MDLPGGSLIKIQLDESGQHIIFLTAGDAQQIQATQQHQVDADKQSMGINQSEMLETQSSFSGIPEIPVNSGITGVAIPIISNLSEETNEIILTSDVTDGNVEKYTEGTSNTSVTETLETSHPQRPSEIVSVSELGSVVNALSVPTSDGVIAALTIPEHMSSTFAIEECGNSNGDIEIQKSVHIPDTLSKSQQFDANQTLTLPSNELTSNLKETDGPTLAVNDNTSLETILKFSKYADFKRALNGLEGQTITKYIIRNQTKDFMNDVCIHDVVNSVDGSSNLPLLRWEFRGARDILPIPYMGIPYISMGKQIFQCHQGKDYNHVKKQQYELQKEILNKMSRNKIKSREKGPSKKIDCPVLFGVRKIYIFPEFSAQENAKRCKSAQTQKLRARLLKIKSQACNCHNNTGQISETIGTLQYLVRFPLHQLHNHDVSKAASSMKLQLKKLGTRGVEAMRLRKSAEANPYQYDKHVELIKVLKSSGDLDQLRSARENMSSIYPLSEELWLEWFEDELPLAELAEQKSYLISLFDTAVRDYASVKIWNEYCQFVMNHIESATDIDRARQVFERAITAVGLHVTEGSSIWNGYREFESAILDSYQQLADSTDAIGMSEKVQSQVEKINQIFKRQLSIPLLGMEESMEAYEDWAPDVVPDETKRAYEKALQKLSLCTEHEEKLQNASGTKLSEFKEYISYELKDGDPARIQCLYERALKFNCLDHELWERYTSYLDSKLRIAHISVEVYKRAVRNCPWISNLWVRYFRAMERNKETFENILEKFEESLKGGFSNASGYLDIWLEQCCYYKRRIGDWETETEKVNDLEERFEQAIKYMNKYFGLEGDKDCVLMKEFAFIQAKYLKNLKKAIELWDTIVKVKAKDENVWLEYIHFLILHGDVSIVRRAFQRAIQVSFEKPEVICSAFLTFEKRYASLTEIDDAQQKVDTQLHKAKERREKEALRESLHHQKKEMKNEKKSKKFDSKRNSLDKKNMKKKRKLMKPPNETSTPAAQQQELASEPTEKKGRINTHTSQHTEEVSSTNTSPPTFKTPQSIPPQSTLQTDVSMSDATTNQQIVTHSNQSNDVTMTTNEQVLLERETKSHCEVTSSVNTHHEHRDEPSVALSHDEKPALNHTGRSEPDDKVNDELSVFLSNLLFTVEEVHIQHMFEKCGAIETIRIIKKQMGKSKGYAYLQFKEKSSVEKALLLDREALQGRPVFVSRCVDKKLNPTQFKFPTTLDKRILYVTNIPFEVSTEELSQLFAQCGKLKQTRIVTNRAGKSKGFAYIEYESEADASTALIKLDKHVLNNRPINVAYSNPPARKQNKNADSANKQSIKEQQNTGMRVKSRTQISLVPRALQRTPRVQPVEIQHSVPDSSTSTDQSVPTSQTSDQTMSNADFRKFLMK